MFNKAYNVEMTKVRFQEFFFKNFVKLTSFLLSKLFSRNFSKANEKTVLVEMVHPKWGILELSVTCNNTSKVL